MFLLWDVERWFRGWVRRRWVAVVAASVPFALLVLPCAGPWLRVLGAAAAARVLYCVCAQFGVSSIWASGRVDAKRRAVLITGCDTGFGHATALRLHAAGVGRVFACVLDGSSAGAEALRALTPRVCVITCDVTDAAAVAAAVDTVRKEILTSDCDLWALVNNAGVLAVGESEWMRVEDVQRALDVNALGQIRTTQAFLPFIRKSKGRIVNINSTSSRIIVPTLTPYTISKYASLGFTESLRHDMSRFCVTVHSIEPWIVKNSLAETYLPLLNKKLNDIKEYSQAVYGGKNAEKLLRIAWSFYNSTSMPTFKSSLVVDAIEDACLSTDPEERYLPGIETKLVCSLKDIVHTFQPIFLKHYFKQ